MHKVDIEYTDFMNDGKRAVETMYFNINAFELAELMLEFDDISLPEYMRQAAAGNMTKDTFKVLKMLFITGYGRRVETDGRSRFIKNPKWIAELLPSPEFDAFYIKLGSDTQFATDFWNNLVTEELIAMASKINEVQEAPKTETTKAKFRDLPMDKQLELMRARAAASGISLDDEV